MKPLTVRTVGGFFVYKGVNYTIDQTETKIAVILPILNLVYYKRLRPKRLASRRTLDIILSGAKLSEELDITSSDMVYSDTPGELRPVLTDFGIDEVDKGVCQDSFENRSILRANHLNWQIIYTDNGEPSGNIEVMSREMASHKAMTTAMDRKLILVDERDYNSDYLTEEALLIEEMSDQLAPLWVIGATRTWCRVREARKEDPKKYPLIAGPPTRCIRIKSDGVRCLLWCSGRATDSGLCRVHLGARSNNISGAVAAARQRAYQAAPTAIAMLEHLMESAESEPVKLKAATEILDRAGVRGGIEIEAKIELNERPAQDVIRERLLRLVPQVLQITETDTDTDNTEEDENE
jgi:hypothetical protein